MESFLPYAHQSIDESDIAAVVDALQGKRSEVDKTAKICEPFCITRGPIVEAFEYEFAQRVGSRYAVAFSNSSAALACAFQAARVGPWDRVITSPNTFIASVAYAVKEGAHLTLIDIDRYGNLDISLLCEEVNIAQSRGKTIVVPVHFAGVAVDMKALDELIRTPEVVIIEDASHALGSTYPDGGVVGSCLYSDMTVFSFHAVKNITTGEGGMVTTNDPMFFERLRTARNSGIERNVLVSRATPEPWYYEVPQISSNYHLTDFQAALGRSQLRRLDHFRMKKDQLVASYRKRLTGVPGVTLPLQDVDSRTHYHLFPVRIAFEVLDMTRTQVMDELAAYGVGSQFHYVPLYNHPSLRYNHEGFVQMEAYYKSGLSLPFFASMTDGDVERVCSALRRVLFRLPHE